MARIVLDRLRKSYGSVEAIHAIDLAIESGEFVVLVGPSGCGKSTLLRMIAGLEEISEGTLSIEGRVVNDLSAAERNVAMVFQDYALYPHMTVAENMAFGLRMRGGDAKETGKRVAGAASALRIGDYLDRRPAELSGGQRQRVAMGRAIVREPVAFLFDEPLSNLDAALRVEMRIEIAKLHGRMKATTVYVTHDQVEAMTLADRIVVMNGGRIEQVGRPLDLYHRPESLFVARFIGSPTMNVVPAAASADGVVEIGGRPVPDLRPRGGKADIVVGIRPEDLRTCDAADAWFGGELVVLERLGSHTYGYVDGGACGLLSIELPREAEFAVGQAVHLRGALDKLHLFDASSGRRVDAL